MSELRYRGRVSLNGHDIATTRPGLMAAFRAVLAQDTPVAFPFNVAEILRFGLGAGTGPADVALSSRLLAEVDLAGYGNRPYHQLSGGEQSRVQLVRVLAQARQTITRHGPTWLFLDEPVASLDVAHQLMVVRIVRRFADAGGGVVAVVHDLNLTAMMADQVLLMRAGQIIGQGSVAEIIADSPLQAAFGPGIRANTLPIAHPWVLPHSA